MSDSSWWYGLRCHKRRCGQGVRAAARSSGGAVVVVIAVLCLLVGVVHALGDGEKVSSEITPETVVRLFWHKIEKNDVDGVMSLFVFSDKARALIPRQRATFAMWAAVMKRGGTSVAVGSGKAIGDAAAVLMTSREGKAETRNDVMYLVRKDGQWRLLPYAVPGDSPANELSGATLGAMVQIKEWVRVEMRKKENEARLSASGDQHPASR